MGELLKFLHCSSNLIIDLTSNVTNSLPCGFIKRDDTLFICKNTDSNCSYDVMRFILKSVIKQNVIVIFDKIDLLKHILSFIRAECSLVFCGEHCDYNNACSLNGMCKSLKICEHYYLNSLNQLNNDENIMKHISLMNKPRV